MFVDDMSGKTVNILAPSDNYETVTLTNTFLWDPVDDADGYRLQIAEPSFANMTKRLLDTLVENNSFQYTLDYGTYEWRVRPENSASQGDYVVRTITIKIDSLQDLAEQVVVLTFPTNNEPLNTMSITFTWDTITYADDYRFELATPDFSGTVLVSGEVLTNNSYSYTFTDEGTYQWRVKAQNELTNSEYTTYTFLIDTTAPAMPVISSPADEASLMDSTVTMSWTRPADTGSSLFDSLFIYVDSLEVNTIKAVKTTSTGYTMDFYRDSTYYWKVRTFDAAGNSGTYTSLYEFTVKP